MDYSRIFETFFSINPQKEYFIFFRNDDVSSDHPQFLRLAKIFSTYSIPLTAAVIPYRCHSSSSVYLMALKERQPLEYIPHGLDHTNWGTEENKSEFPTERSNELVKSDIKLAIQLMNEHFKDSWTPIFCPPWNNLSETAIDALIDNGINKVTTSIHQQKNDQRRVDDIPIAISLFSKEYKSTEKVLKWLTLATEVRPVIGLLTHHQTMASSDFHSLEKLLRYLINCQRVHFCSISEVAR